MPPRQHNAGPQRSHTTPEPRHGEARSRSAPQGYESTFCPCGSASWGTIPSARMAPGSSHPESWFPHVRMPPFSWPSTIPLCGRPQTVYSPVGGLCFLAAMSDIPGGLTVRPSEGRVGIPSVWAGDLMEVLTAWPSGAGASVCTWPVVLPLQELALAGAGAVPGAFGDTQEDALSPSTQQLCPGAPRPLICFVLHLHPHVLPELLGGLTLMGRGDTSSRLLTEARGLGAWEAAWSDKSSRGLTGRVSRPPGPSDSSSVQSSESL